VQARRLELQPNASKMNAPSISLTKSSTRTIMLRIIAG
jgi:hypothetical protein